MILWNDCSICGLGDDDAVAAAWTHADVYVRSPRWKLADDADVDGGSRNDAVKVRRYGEVAPEACIPRCHCCSPYSRLAETISCLGKQLSRETFVEAVVELDYFRY